MSAIRQSSPFRTDLEPVQQLEGLQAFILKQSLPTATRKDLELALGTLLEESFDIKGVEIMTGSEAKELQISGGVLNRIRREIKPFKQWYKKEYPQEVGGNSNDQIKE
jgi:hypothetical protein